MTLVKICFPRIFSKLCKNTSELVGPVLNDLTSVSFELTFTQLNCQLVEINQLSLGILDTSD